MIMKRMVVSMALVCLACVSAWAGGIKVVSGDKKVFKNAEGSAVLEIVFDGATYDDKMPLAENEKFSDMASVKKIAMAGFTEYFNKKSKSVKISESADGAKYKISLQVSKMDQYVKVMGFIPAPATKTWGTLTITDLATGQVLTTVEVNAVDGGANPSPDGCISDSFEKIGEEVAKLK